MPPFQDKLQRPLPHFLWLYLASLTLPSIATIVGVLFHTYISPYNLVILYLLAVVLAVLKLGIRPAILTAVTSVLAFDLFFVPGRLASTILNDERLPVFVGIVIVGLVISSLVVTAQKRAEVLREREAETASLYLLSRELSATPDYQSLYEAIIRNAEASIAAQVAIFCAADQIIAPVAASKDMSFTDVELSTIEWSCKTVRQSITPSGSEDSARNLVCLPLVQAGRCMGILALRNPLPGSGSQRLVEGFIMQTASALQRIELSHAAEQAQVIQTRANFERALLNSISHDLRTPLASITGALSTLREKNESLSNTARQQLLDTACSEADRLNRFVGNLLDMTRIEAGVIQLNAEPCEVDELIGCALNALEQRIGTRRINVALPEKLPLVNIDLVLMIQVLLNLLDNSLKYSSPQEPITISAHYDSTWIVLEVADHGPGIPKQDLERVFDKFYRIPIPEGAGGTGLGLSICKGIVEAHGGRIKAENRPEGGVKMLIYLPLEGAKT